MKAFAQRWSIGIERTTDGRWSTALMRSDAITGDEELSYESYGSSNTLFQELLTVLDASIFTSLAIAEGVLPEGQLRLL